MFKRLAAILLLLLAGYVSRGADFLRFVSLGSDDGLSQNTINVIYKDRLGFMWIGTQDGLNRFDGKTFKVFKKSHSGKNSIGANQITSLAEDAAGNLWIGTWQFGVSVYYPKADSFFVYHHQRGNEEWLQDNAVAGLFFYDSSLLLIGYSNGSIDLFNIHTKTVTHLFVSPSEKTYNLFKTSFVKDRAGRVWAGSRRQGLLLLDIPGKKVHKFPLSVSFYFSKNEGKVTKPVEVNDMMALDDQHLLLATSGTGLVIFNTDDHRYRQVNLMHPDQYGTNRFNYTTAIEKKNDSVFWIGTMDRGLVEYNYKSGEKHCFNSFTRNTNLSFDNIGSLFKDDQGTLWVGTKGMGLNLLSSQTSFFKTIRSKGTYPQLHFESVRTLYKKGNELYVGGYNGLDRVDLQQNTCTPVLNSGFIPYHITELPGDPGHLWMAMEGGNELVRLNVANNRFEYVQPNTLERIDSGKWLPYFRIQPFGDSLLWLGGINGRLLLFDYKNRKTVRMFSAASNAGFLSGTIRALCLTKDNRLWVGSSSDGILVLNPFNYQVVRRFNNLGNQKEDLHFNTVYAIVESRNGKIWLCTDNGFYVYNDSTDSFRGYFVSHGLKNDNVYAAAEDNKGCFWLSTNGGLSYFNPQNETFINYGVKDGLQGNEFNSNAWYSDSSSGFCAFGGIHGLTWFNFDNYVEDTINVKVLFTGVYLNYKPLDIRPSITYRSSLDIPARTYNLTIKFSGLDYLNPWKIWYRYKINNGKWVFLGNKDEITLGKLRYGENTLLVNASNTSGKWSTQNASITLNYLSPFYLKPWFYLLVVSFVGLAIFLFVHLRLYVLKKREQMLMAEVKAATGELMKTQKELRAQIARKEIIEKQLRESNATKNKMFSIIAHDLTSPFNSLLGFIDLLKTDFDSLTHEEMEQYINALHVNSKNLFSFVKNLLIWSRSQQNVIQPSPETLLLRREVDRLLDVHRTMAVNKGIRLVNRVPETVRVYMDRNLLDTILRNLISNALKFSYSGNKVEISAIQKGTSVQVIVKDQGVGMDKESVETLFDPERKIKSRGTQNEEGTGLGLLIVKEFVEKSNGTVRVESKPGKGTTFVLTLPAGR